MKALSLAMAVVALAHLSLEAAGIVPLGVWRNHYFDSTHQAQQLHLNEADPNHDNVENLLKYSFGGNPWAYETDLFPKVVENNGHLELHFWRVPGATDLRYFVEVSGDSLNWFGGPSEVEIVSSTRDGADRELVVARDKTPLQADDPGFIRLRVESLETSPVTLFEQWKAHHFDSAQRLAELDADDADPNDDGVENLLKYSYGGDPWTLERHYLPAIEEKDSHLLLHYWEVIDATDIRYIVEVSDDMDTWVSGPGNVEILNVYPDGNGRQKVTARDLTAMSVDEPRFIRLRIEHVWDFVVPWTFHEWGFIDGEQDGEERVYNDPGSVVASPWSILPGNNGLRLEFEDDGNCADYNHYIQTGRAIAEIELLVPKRLHITWSGLGERQDSNYELMSIYINPRNEGWFYADKEYVSLSYHWDYDFYGAAHAPGGGHGCNPDPATGLIVGPVVSNPTPPQFVDLPAGTHTIVIESTTSDPWFHVGAYYQFELSFEDIP